MEVKLKIDGRSKEALALLDYLRKLPFVKMESKEEIHNTELLKKLKRSKEQIKKGEYYTLDANDVWGSLGL